MMWMFAPWLFPSICALHACINFVCDSDVLLSSTVLMHPLWDDVQLYKSINLDTVAR